MTTNTYPNPLLISTIILHGLGILARGRPEPYEFWLFWEQREPGGQWVARHASIGVEGRALYQEGGTVRAADALAVKLMGRLLPFVQTLTIWAPNGTRTHSLRGSRTV